MAHLVQLSDLHLLANPVEQAGIFDGTGDFVAGKPTPAKANQEP